MSSSYRFPEYAYRPAPEQKSGRIARKPAIVVGAGPIGLSLAIDLAERGVPVVVLDDNNTVSVGSRAICFSKRTLEVLDRLGVGERALDKGVVWKVGKVFRDTGMVYQFDLLPESGHKMPAFINLQQYYLEEYLVERCMELGDLIDIRWKNKVVAAADTAEGVRFTIDTPDGSYCLDADYGFACDGAKSDIRRMIGAEFEGQAFQDRFLIADVRMKADFPAERWFWFDPPFHRGQSVLLHMQPDNVWRIDFQLGWQADPEEEKKPERVIPRLKAMLGEDMPFDLEWVSVYQFACRRMKSFRHGRLMFVGDAAHQVSPFGARGANSGIQDVDNLGWKIKLVLDGTAPDRLLDTYDEERTFAADDNLRNSTRSTDFITPKSPISKAFRDAALDLAEDLPFARALVNSGRLSLPTPYVNSSLNTPDKEPFTGNMTPGACCADAPITIGGEQGWLLNALGKGFSLLHFPDREIDLTVTADLSVQHFIVGKTFEDAEGLAAERYDGKPGTTYLIRPDQHIAARWRSFDAAKVRAALDRAMAK